MERAQHATDKQNNFNKAFFLILVRSISFTFSNAIDSNSKTKTDHKMKYSNYNRLHHPLDRREKKDHGICKECDPGLRVGLTF